MNRLAMRGTARVVAGLAVGALALTACGDDKKDNSGGGSGDKPTYTIGYQGPLSGDNAQLGINEQLAVKLAIDEANKKGDLPFTLKEADSDDQGSETLGDTAAQKLIDNSNVMAVIGPAFSGATSKAEGPYAQAKLTSISPSATRADLTQASNGFTSFFRVLQTDGVQGPQLADYVSKGLKAKLVYVVDDKTQYGSGLATFVTDELKKNSTPYKTDSQLQAAQPGGSKDYSALSIKVKNSGADALVYAGYYADLALFAKALKNAGYTGKIISADGSKDGELIKQGGDAVEGVYLTCPCADSNTDPKAATFAAAYKALNGVDPSTYSAEAYDATNVAIAAMKSIGKDITREKVLAAVKTISYTGITKEIKFESNGEVGGESIYLYEVEGGTIKVQGLISELIK